MSTTIERMNLDFLRAMKNLRFGDPESIRKRNLVRAHMAIEKRAASSDPSCPNCYEQDPRLVPWIVPEDVPGPDPQPGTHPFRLKPGTVRVRCVRCEETFGVNEDCEIVT